MKPEFMGLLDNYLPRTAEILAGRYRLEEEIGRGAFGVVFRAVHEALGSNVAVKVLRPRVVDEPHVRKRFEREIAVAKTLQHPNSIRILDVDATLKGRPFYVMEYVDGRTLREVISEDGPRDVQRVGRVTN
jgi:serine/threonine-protein kinase